MEHATKRTWAEISLGNLSHNYRALRGMLPPGCRFLGVVKANAYGHGALPVARKLEQLGAEYLAVSCLDEAIQLREGAVKAPILILGHTAPAYAGELIHHHLTQTVSDWETAAALSQAAEQEGAPLKIHVKADTGMSRLGFLCDEGHLEGSAAEVAGVCALPGLEAEGIFTHFANADGDEDYTMLQLTRFLDTIKNLEGKGVHFPLRHCAASAAVLNYPCTHLDMVRPGIALYGHYPDPACQGLDGPGLLPVMTLKTRVAAVRELPAGSSVSYGCTYTAQTDQRVAVLSVGYADGFSRLLSGRARVVIGGVSCPVLGRVCMDMCMVGVDQVPQVKPGDEVTLYGEGCPVEEDAGLAGTISYELLCAVSPRVPRIYLE